MVAALALIQVAAGGKAAVKSVRASSTLKSNDDRYRAEHLFDGTKESWCEGSNGSGTGERLTFQLDGPKTVQTIIIENGIGYRNYYSLNNRVKAITVNGARYAVKDTPGPQVINLSSPVSGTVTITITDVYRGSKWDDTCIAEIGFVPVSAGGTDFAAITGKSYAAPEGMEMHGTILEFKNDMSFTSNAEACGDETCPQTAHGTCKSSGSGTCTCTFTKWCRGVTVSQNPWRVDRRCDKLKTVFTLTIKNGEPAVTLGKKSARLQLFD